MRSFGPNGPSQAGPGTPILDRVTGPADLRVMSDATLTALAHEVRAEVIAAVSVTGGHLGASLGCGRTDRRLACGIRYAA